MQRQVSFNRVPEVPEKVPGGFGAELGVRFNRSGEGLGGFGAEPGRLNRVPEKVPEKVPGSAKPSQVHWFRRRLQKPNQVRFI